MNTNSDAQFWFSHITTEYEVYNENKRKKFILKEEKPPIKIDWDNCSVEFSERLDNGDVRFTIRSHTNRNSEYMGNIPVRLRFLFNLVVTPRGISEVREEKQYDLSSSNRKNLPQSAREIIHDRWVFNLGPTAEVWEWAQTGRDLRSGTIWRLREEIRKTLDSPGSTWKYGSGKDATQVMIENLDEVIPVIYQPAIDSLDSFLREVHCAQITNSDGSIDIEVTLVFNNEQLRKFKLVDGFYRWFRKIRYGRLIDVETFKIHFLRAKVDEDYFIFEGIYSGDHDLIYDTIHLDKPPNTPHRPIKYFLTNNFHPIVFVNTSNHAMAEHDNNSHLWKWEYIPWADKAPVIFGTKSRKEIDKQYRSIFDRILMKE